MLQQSRGKPIWRSRLFWQIFSVLLVASFLLDGLYSYRSWSQLVEERTHQAWFLTQAVLDRISQEQAEDHEKIRTHLQSVAFGSIYYAQFVHQGEVHVDLRGPDVANLTLEPLEVKQPQTQRIWIGGLLLLDVITPLRNFPGYIRLGFSLTDIAWRVGREAVLIGGMSLATVLGLSLLIGSWLSLRSTKQIEFEDGTSSSLRETPSRPITTPAVIESVACLNGVFRIDDAGKKVFTEDGRAIALPPKEYSLLQLLASQRGRVFPEEEIRQVLWPNDPLMTRKDSTHYIYLLRKRLKEHGLPLTVIENVRGHGYKLSI